MSDNYRPDLSEFGVIIPPESDSTTRQKEHPMAQPSEPATVRLRCEVIVAEQVPNPVQELFGSLK